MDVKLFWHYCELKRVELTNLHNTRLRTFETQHDESIFEGQPRDGKGLFISSRFIPGVQDGGFIVYTGFRLAAQRIIEQTHEVASIDQIRQFQAEALTHSLFIKEVERHLAGRSSVQVSPTQPSPRGETR